MYYTSVIHFYLLHTQEIVRPSMMIRNPVLRLQAPPLSASSRRYTPQCGLTQQGHRFLSAVAVTSKEPSATSGLLRRFVASSSRYVTLTTLLHIISPSCSIPHLSFIAFPLYSMIEQKSWFRWNTKVVADLIAFLHKEGRFDEAEKLFDGIVSKLGFDDAEKLSDGLALNLGFHKEKELYTFYINLITAYAVHKHERGCLDACEQLKQLILSSSSVHLKKKGYLSMILGLCEIGLPYKAEILMDEMRENGITVSSYEMKSVVYGYGQNGFLEDMKRVVGQMENEGFELDTICFNMVLSSFGANNKLHDMLVWLKKMRDLNVPLSVRTYNSVLNSCPRINSLVIDAKNWPLSIDELSRSLESDEEVNLVMELMKTSVLDEAMVWNENESRVDLHGMHLASAYLILLQWFNESRVRFDCGNYGTPKKISIVCGRGKNSPRQGDSPVKKLAKEMVVRMKCPLIIDKKNSGCFIGKGIVFRKWLLDTA
ncbi:pentatricopeptide repeat-containing protein [Striga asiatica]|uniref:Pentatricopeptide repeat-containing protein n=1 Tax=Striga asiatica TaxID=4170 RepID=A0A5A7QDB7_STRAF|nr:pentatricopeptide repeat-containing protein [Striga asiatica]